MSVSMVSHLQIITFLQRRDAEKISLSPGIYLSFALYFTYFSQTVAFQQYFNLTSTVEVMVRGALTAQVYRKSCLLSPQSRSKYTSGQIQNLMSNDSRTVAEVIPYIHMLWSAIEQVIVAMMLLINLLGLAPTLAGIIFIASAIPFQSILAAKIKNLRESASYHTDDRVKVLSEVVKGIKLVKLYAWEFSFIKRILSYRAKELRDLRNMTLYGVLSSVLYTGVPTSLTLIVFAVYAVLGNKLDAAIVFPAITLFNILRPAMVIFPYTLVNAARAAAALSRLKRFFTAEELTPLHESNHAIDQNILRDSNLHVGAINAAFQWDPSNQNALPSISSVSIFIPKGALVAIVGSTGSGKSTLLAGMLGEIPIVEGKAGILKGTSIAYCDQVPFIQNATVRENILFGKPFDTVLYRKVVKVCCLEPDLEILPAGDQTEIGGRGVNLSGGQRARVSLARAVYARADLYLLDDPLSAVDAHVGKAIFERCICKQLSRSTRILSTNQIHFAAAPEVDIVVVVKDGKLVEFGHRHELLSDQRSEFSKLLRSASQRLEGEHMSERDKATNGTSHEGIQQEKRLSEGVNPVEEKTSNQEENGTMDYGAIESGKLIQKEGKEEGNVRLKHYWYYLSAMGMAWVLSTYIFAFLNQGFLMSVNVWISWWSEKSMSESEKSSVWFNLLVFAVLGFCGIFMSLFAALSIAFGSIRASVLLHERLLLSVMGAPSSFYNATPDGRLVNRFTSDLDKIDQSIASTLQAMNRLLISLCFTFGLIVWVSPTFILFLIPVSVMCIMIQEYYRRTSVDLRRLEALARSPLYSHFSETLEGVTTLRAYGDIPRSSHISHVYTDQLNKAMYSTVYTNRWLALHLEMMSTILILGATLLAVTAPVGKLSASMMGLMLSYTAQILGSITWAVRQFTELSSEMSAVERVHEYSEPPFPQEERGGLSGLLKEIQDNKKERFQQEGIGLISNDTAQQLDNAVGSKRSRWPKHGIVEFENVVMRYRSDLSPALRNVTFVVEPGEHIGIVGRTGAGKSSAIQSLFRLYELAEGTIKIDGTDIKRMRLQRLRSSLGVIPQEPVCFSGTLRTNLDMFGEHQDEEIEKALEACGLQRTMREQLSLDMEIQENGANLSVGQRQLLCLGRALLKDSQVVVLDEATSNVSTEFDEKIQQTLREEMSHCTILTVAHRLHTVMKSDRIFVMDGGRVAESGKPKDLLSGPSLLSALVDETGPSTAAHLRQMAMKKDELRRPAARKHRDGDTVHGENGWANGNARRFDLSEEMHHESARETVRSALKELCLALRQTDETGAQELVDVYQRDGRWRELLRTVALKLWTVTKRATEEMAENDIDIDVDSGSNVALADMLHNMRSIEKASHNYDTEKDTDKQ